MPVLRRLALLALAATLLAPAAAHAAWDVRPVETGRRSVGAVGVVGLPDGRAATVLANWAGNSVDLAIGEERTRVFRGQFLRDPVVAADARGRVTVATVAFDGRTRNEYLHVWADGRTQWVPLRSTAVGGSAADGVDLDVAADGTAVLAWHDGTHARVARRAPGAPAFGTPVDLPEPATPPVAVYPDLPYPRAAALEGGGAAVAYGDALVLARDAGPFGAPRRIALPPRSKLLRDLAVVATSSQVTYVYRDETRPRGAKHFTSVLQATTWDLETDRLSGPVTIPSSARTGGIQTAVAGDRVFVAFKDVAGARTRKQRGDVNVGIVGADGRFRLTGRWRGPGAIRTSVLLAPDGDGLRAYTRNAGRFVTRRFDRDGRPDGPAAGVATPRHTSRVVAGEAGGRPLLMWTEFPPRPGGANAIRVARPRVERATATAATAAAGARAAWQVRQVDTGAAEAIHRDVAALPDGGVATLLELQEDGEHVLELRAGREREEIARTPHGYAPAHLGVDDRGRRTVAYGAIAGARGARHVYAWSDARTAPQRLDTGLSKSTNLLDLDVARDGSAVVAWGNGDTVYAARRAPGDDAFAPAVAVATGVRRAWPVAAALPGGGAVVAFDGTLVRAPSAGAPFGPPQALRLPDATRDLDRQALAVTARGNVVYAYRARVRTGRRAPNTRVVQAAVWSPGTARPIGPATFSRTDLPGAPALTVAGGEAYLAFKEAPSDGDRDRADVRALVVAPDGTGSPAGRARGLGPVSGALELAPDGDGVRAYTRVGRQVRTVRFAAARPFTDDLTAGAITPVLSSPTLLDLQPIEAGGRPLLMWSTRTGTPRRWRVFVARPPGGR